jgi:hypothetical protein
MAERLKPERGYGVSGQFGQAGSGVVPAAPPSGDRRACAGLRALDSKVGWT